MTPLVHHEGMHEHDTPHQLTLLRSSDVPVQFLIDADTRRRGIRHIAEIRRQLAERQAQRLAVTPIAGRSPHRPEAA